MTHGPVERPLTRISLRRELLAHGIDDRAIASRLQAGELHRVRHGAYVDGPTWRSYDDVSRHRVRARAVLREARSDLVLSHVSGLVEWGVPMWDLDLARVPVDVTRTDRRGGRREVGVRQHYGVLAPGDIVERAGVRVTGPTRTALDAITVLDVEHSLAAVNDLLHRGLTTVDALATQSTSMARWPYSLSKHVVLRLATGACESVGESRVQYLCWQQGLPVPIPQFPVVDRRGRIVAYVDFAWPEYGVFLEFDGRVKYEALRREGESVTDVVLREKRREEMICELTGWRCLRVIWADCYEAERVAARVRRLFEAQSRAAFVRAHG